MTNQRLINTTKLYIFFVNGFGEYNITSTERTYVLAEIQEGLEALGENEPGANISWKYPTIFIITLDSVTPWQGANWKALPEAFYKGVDAAVWRESNKKVYFFKGSQYVRIEPSTRTMDSGYPKDIVTGWPGLPADFNQGLDAAVYPATLGKIYFFKGSQYVRIDPENATVDAGYPKPIAGNWKDLPSSFNNGIDAAVWRESNKKIYFFKGSQYVRIEPSTRAMDSGYPKDISGKWQNLPPEAPDFNQGIDAALYLPINDRIYFFKNGRTVGYYVRIDPANATMDADYPKPIGLSGEDAEDLWRDPAQYAAGMSPGRDGVRKWVEEAAAKDGSNAYCAFITKFPTVWFAYAQPGHRFVVLRHAYLPEEPSFESWSSLDRIFAHETGHIFGAPDEYAASKCNCGGSFGNFFKTNNGNCVNCATPSVGCLMKSNDISQICEFTNISIGWAAFLVKIDASIFTPDNSKIYLFSNDYYVRCSDINNDITIDDGYPKLIAGNWKDLPSSFNNGIDAAVWRESSKKIYFFKGSQYVRVEPSTRTMDSGYPKDIATGWHGLPAEFNQGLDAAVHAGTLDKIYFFKGSQYVRIDPETATVDAGYPKPIAGNWKNLPSSFNNGIDAAIWRESNKKVYFFNGKTYARIEPSTRTMDEGYPKWIDNAWMPFPKS